MGELLPAGEPKEEILGESERLCKTILQITTPQTRTLLTHVQMMTSFAQGDPEEGEEERRIRKTLLHMVASEFGLPILTHLLNKGCVTSLELWSGIPGLKRQGAEYHRETLEGLGLVKTYAEVGDVKGLQARHGKAQIWGWVGLPSEYVLEARKRYLTHFEVRPLQPVDSVIYQTLLSRHSYGGPWDRDKWGQFIQEDYPDMPTHARLELAHQLTVSQSRRGR